MLHLVSVVTACSNQLAGGLTGPASRLRGETGVRTWSLLETNGQLSTQSVRPSLSLSAVEGAAPVTQLPVKVTVLYASAINNRSTFSFANASVRDVQHSKGSRQYAPV